MAKITSHNDLEVYKKAFDASMRIYTLTLAFPKEELYSLPIRFGGHRGRCVRILQKRGGSGGTRRRS